uniref:J domain-containing protein n=1 Tax=Lankesteria abbotti TaxID=340204 RepID=A0A6T5UQU1_9APIC|mmetsp:Transcript_2031/g.2484  ORF Transcript_2031/g.2484 Transcript_2031/m.2484 type:complete len:340 (+) Transcript_2031:76-1095(+)
MDGLAFNLIFLHPMIQMMTDRRRRWNKHSPLPGFVLAVVVLLVVSSGGYSSEPNLYKVLSSEPRASRASVQSSFRHSSKYYHPDANSNPGAAEMFRQLTRAQKILSDRNSRNSYHRFGDMNVGRYEDDEEVWKFTPKRMLWTIITTTCYRITFSLIMESLYGLRHLYPYRMYMLASVSLEWFLRFDVGGDTLFASVPVFNRLLPFEQIKFIHCLAPFFLNIGSVWSDFVTEPIDALLMKSNESILCMLLQNQIQFLKAISSRRISNHEVELAHQSFLNDTDFPPDINNMLPSTLDNAAELEKEHLQLMHQIQTAASRRQLFGVLWFVGGILIRVAMFAI